MNYKIQGQEIYTLLRFYGELVKFIIGPKALGIVPFFILPTSIFQFCLIIWYDIFSGYLVENDCSKMIL